MDDNKQGRLIDVEIEKEMKDSYLAYSMSVIVGRALPDVRDGLKQVHRRILYTMYEANNTPDNPYRKCAYTVGEVLGRFHPTETRASMMRWCAWRRIFHCGCRWSTATETSVQSMETPPLPIVIPRRG